MYVTYSEGFKSGGFPAAPQTAADARKVLDQEEAQNYEFGVKSDISDNVRMNLSLFYTEYEGLQYQNFGSVPGEAGSFGRFLTFNAGDAKVSGVELEGTWQVTDSFTLSGFAAYTDSEFGKTNIANAAANANQEGNPLLRTPQWKYALNADYEISLSGGSYIDLSANYNYVDEQRADLPSYVIQPEFELLDLRISWRSSDDQYKWTLWAKNAMDEEYISHIYTIAGGSVTAVYGDPRMFGVTANIQF